MGAPEPPWPARRTFRVAYADVDVLNHLNHAVYFRWMETLRCDYYLPLLGSADPRSLDIILLEASCRFLRPAGYGTEMVGEVSPVRPLGRTSFTLQYRFTSPGNPGTRYAEGRTVVVTYNYGTGQKKPIDGTIGQQLERDARNALPSGPPRPDSR